MRPERVWCWEAFDVNDPLVRAAEQLYEATQHPDERIPWGWIARSIRGRSQWRPGSWGKHLLLATPAPPPDGAAATRGADWKPRADAAPAGPLCGFAYGAHLPDFGGYVCYIGVDPAARGKGVGGRLMEQMFKVQAADAGAGDEPLPFVVWESHRPEPGAPAEDWQLWEARTRLFERVGGLWIDGVELLTPNYGEDDGPPVPLQLFLRPMEKAAATWTADDLRGVARGLLERVYRMRPGEPHYDATLTGAVRPRLRPAREATRRRALAGV